MAKRIVCLGEALVDFVCERPVAALGEADFFVPRPGGSLVNIAVCAARFAGDAELLGGAGDDEWGRWLRARIAAEGVGVERFALTKGAGTSHAFVSVGADGEPSFAFYGDVERPAARAGEALDTALAGEGGVLVVGSDTLLGAEEREVTMRAVALARERGWQVLCDPNLRPNRWGSEEEMVRAISALIAGASVVKLNEGEALRLSGCAELEAAGRWLLGLGPAAAVITRGGDGASVFTAAGAERVAGCDADVVDATGAGDCVTGVVAAGLALGADPNALAAVLGVAMQAAAGVVSVWGATEGLPAPETARALLAAAL